MSHYLNDLRRRQAYYDPTPERAPGALEGWLEANANDHDDIEAIFTQAQRLRGHPDPFMMVKIQTGEDV